MTRVGLINEGTYPVAMGGVSTWCDQLVRGLPDTQFELVTLVGPDRGVVWELPPNVNSVTTVGMWDAVRPGATVAAQLARPRLRKALHDFWSAVLPRDADAHVDTGLLDSALRRLCEPLKGALLPQLTSAGSVRAIIAAYSAHSRTRNLPQLTLQQAAKVASLVDPMIAVADTQWPQVDVVHAASNGPAAVIALARHWRDGTPIVLTEHGLYLRERYLGLGALDMPFAVRYAVMTALRGVCQVAYRYAKLLAPVSDFNARWEERLGADPQRVITIHNGVDTSRFHYIDHEPEVPTVSFVGRIDPLKDLHTLITAFRIVADRVPNAKLRLFGPTPPCNTEYEKSLRQKVSDLNLDDAVTFEGRVPSALPAIEAGHVVALSSISEGLPFTVMEAMMAGRATVNTDVGGVREVTGDDGTAGIVVPPRDATAMGKALAELLEQHDRRQAMGINARERALTMFDLTVFQDRYRDVYAYAGERMPNDTIDLELHTIIDARTDHNLKTERQQS